MANILTYENWKEERHAELLNQYSDALAILQWAYQEYGKDIIYSCSFGAEGMVLIDLIYKVNKEAKIVFLDTGLHFPETYELMAKVKKHYPSLSISSIQPQMNLKQQEKWYGEDLWKINPHLCCHLRKVIPLKEILSDVKAWITGLRREQSPERRRVQFINKDDKFRKIKICPLIHWTWNDVMNYLHIHQIPYNPLHDKGYPSIGCATCTRPVLGDDDSRSGRWTGFSKTECGLHQN
nr:phosphoadenylyl-sulfate reductase [uncultured Bacillus sp.]